MKSFKIVSSKIVKIFISTKISYATREYKYSIWNPQTKDPPGVGVFFEEFYSVAFASISASSIGTAVTRFDELFDISASRGPAPSPVFDRLISLQAF